MRKYLISSAFLVLGCFSFSAELATVMGKPSDKIAKDMIEAEFDLVGDSKVHDSSTWVYSLLKREGVLSTAAIYVLDGDSGSKDDFVTGLEIATEYAPVVMTNLGPIDGTICSFMAAYPDTAFVVIAGNEAREIDLNSRLYSSCAAKNILVVAALDQENNTLMPSSNYGSMVDIAAPGNSIEVEGDDGKTIISGSTPAVSLVAAQLAIFARENPNLKGKDLIDEFLFNNSDFEADLLEKVEGGRIYKHGNLFLPPVPPIPSDLGRPLISPEDNFVFVPPHE